MLFFNLDNFDFKYFILNYGINCICCVIVTRLYVYFFPVIFCFESFLVYSLDVSQQKNTDLSFIPRHKIQILRFSNSTELLIIFLICFKHHCIIILSLRKNAGFQIVLFLLGVIKILHECVLNQIV